GIAQEIYALLATYQAIRIAIADATESTTGTDPDRASFTIALEPPATRSSRPTASSPAPPSTLSAPSDEQS
ncbi:hypothetical protein NMG29_34085, partial [Streptomyces cocklensis]|nr:hypothetical protein [Actinacidiphila cocklensis]